MGEQAQSTPELLELAGDDAVNVLALSWKEGCQTLLDGWDKWFIYWAAFHSKRPTKELYAQAVIVVGYGWPAELVAHAIRSSEAYDATGLDYWLNAHGYREHFPERCKS